MTSKLAGEIQARGTCPLYNHGDERLSSARSLRFEALCSTATVINKRVAHHHTRHFYLRPVIISLKKARRYVCSMVEVLPLLGK